MANNWPREKDRFIFFGNPSRKDGTLNPLWEITNITFYKPPWQITYAGAPYPRGFKVHKKVVASLDRICQEIWNLAGKSQAKIKEWGLDIYSGGYEYRVKRGGDTLSNHAIGAALDFDASRNQFHDETPNFANIPQVVKAFEKEGWYWRGHVKGRGCDGMHFEAINRL